MHQAHLALFLDYDGTLAPIAAHPSQAVLSDDMRSLLSQLSDRATVAIISGRDLADLQQRVALPGLHYAGSHGFDMLCADGRAQVIAQTHWAVLDEAERQLREYLNGIAGVIVERKRFAIAAHYRSAPDSGIQVQQAIAAVVQAHPQLRQRGGKKIFEIQPDIPWNKGYAVSWILSEFPGDRSVVPLYIGDDVTDEDAFAALTGYGITIRVGAFDQDQPTHADYRLQHPEEVRQFCQRVLCYILQKNQGG